MRVRYAAPTKKEKANNVITTTTRIHTLTKTQSKDPVVCEVCRIIT